MERRAEERRLVREERLSRQSKQEEEQQIADAHEAQASPKHRPVAQRSKLVVEMEQRAEERRRIREERRLWHQQREEERQAEEKAAEEALRQEEEEQRRMQIQEQRERKRAEQRAHAEKLVAIAQHRQQVRQAYEFWVRNRLVDVWCAFRQAVIEADEMQLVAWLCYRRALLRGCFAAWGTQHIRLRTAREACRIARARIADWYFFRHVFRRVIFVLRLAVQRSEWQVQAGRTLLAHVRARTSARTWQKVAAETSFARRCVAVRHYASWVLRYALKWWLEGTKQSRLDAELLRHKQVLHAKVSGWLREIDLSTPALSNPTLS
jgi:hypothetical protein